MEWKNLLNESREKESGSTSEHRTEFRRDYDRIVFSTPYRRLQDKAQVYPLEPNDSVRTRLTHSNEVSTVAAGIASAVCHKLQKAGKQPTVPGWGDDRVAHSIEAIAATVGLVHDFGNPPFGHAGEVAIRDWFDNKRVGGFFIEWKFKGKTGEQTQLAQDLLKFDGNAQTMRLLTRLQVLYNHGVNLTYGTLSASRKYIATSDDAKAGQAFKNPGYFASEEEMMRTISQKTGTEGVRNPITVMVEAADDITYCLDDVEDSVRKGVVTWSEFYAFLIGCMKVRNAGERSRLDFIFEKCAEYSGLKADEVPLTDREYVQFFRIFE